VGAQEIVDVREGRGHATCFRLICGAPQQRVEPDEAVTAAPEPSHLASELFGITAVPSVADDQHDRAMTEHAARMVSLEGVQRVSDTRPATDVVHLRGNVVERGVDVAMAEEMRDSRQVCRKREGLDPLAGADHMREHQQMT